MLVYWTGCILTCVLTWFVTHIKNKKNTSIHKICRACIASLPLIIIASIRYAVGADYFAYMRYFQGICFGRGQGRFEYVYYVLNKVIAWLGLGFAGLLFGTAVIFMLLISLQVMEDSPYPAMSMFFLVSMTYYFIFFNAIRQLVGCAILMFSIRYIHKKKFCKFLFCVVLATGFHTTCALFLVAYFVDKIHIQRIKTIVFSAAFIVASPVIANLANTILLNSKYETYVDSIYDTGKQGYIVLMLNIALLGFSMVFYDKENPKFEVYYKLQLISMWLASMGGQVVLLERIRWIFGLPSIVLVPMTIKSISNKKLRYCAGFGIVVLYAVYFSYTVGVGNSNLVLPYRTIFSM